MLDTEQPWREPEASSAGRQLEAILDGFGDGFIAFDADWRITHCNHTAAEHFASQAPHLIGKVLWDVFPQTVGSPIEAAVRQVMASRKPLETQTQSRVRPGVIVDLRVFPLDAGVGVSLRDVTELRAAEARLRESEERFRAMADTAPAPVWVTTAAGPIEFVNRAFAEYVGRPREELMGDVWLDLLHPDDLAEIVRTRAQARGGHVPYTYEARFKRHDGVWRTMLISSSPRFHDLTGEFLGYVGIATDITDQRAAEVRQQLLINELNHRVKNTLATVQSLARQTLKDGDITREARDRLTERLLALSAAHNVLTRQNWESAELAEIAAEAVRPYVDGAAPRIVLAGPLVRVAPNVALAISMALHELATNATKYGALSLPEGRVELRWRAEAGAVDLEWRESGGPAVSPPPGRGFGSRLLSQGLAAELGAPATLDWRPEGLVCAIRAPAAG
ncbi:sensor histidine kinase [Phenylobacterium sp.]|uniref:sensor histidine kinase n=1 Tax=Phenylobacterium sp. TaxID=1871053 RepID=UPI002F93B415